MKAVIYKSTGNFYLAKEATGIIWNCRMRGKLKVSENFTSTNPIAVGDHVELSIENEKEQTAIITDILIRNNYIVRTSPHNHFQKHIIAANLDQAFLITTIKNPRTSQGFIDRFLVTAEAYHIPVIIVFNKSDIHHGAIQDKWEIKKKIFEDVGYKTITVSALEENGFDILKNELHKKVSLFSGHSGVGKSTLINHLKPGKNLKVAEISSWSEKGRHTTTFAEMIDLPFGGSIIDTPGVKEFGIVDLKKEELSHYFPEMKALLNNCKFNNCIHKNEPGCAVKAAIINGGVRMERYLSYLELLDSL